MLRYLSRQHNLTQLSFFIIEYDIKKLPCEAFFVIECTVMWDKHFLKKNHYMITSII